jgi:hypothetical protein
MFPSESAKKCRAKLDDDLFSDGVPVDKNLVGDFSKHALGVIEKFGHETTFLFGIGRIYCVVIVQ